MKKFARILAFAACLLMLLGSIPVNAITPYSTYTYSIDGFALVSPDAYVPDRIIDSTNIYYDGDPVEIVDPRDMFVDKDKNVYLVLGSSNQVVVMNSFFNVKFIISTFTNEHGVPDSLAGPSGVFVAKDKIYVADTDNKRIVMFNIDGSFYKTIEEPDADVFPEGSIYKPVAVAVDDYGRIYVVSSTTYMGVIAINEDGIFQGFVGAQQVSISALDIFWRRFMTAEQRAQSQAYVSTEYNNITMDSNGFIYVTTSSIAESSQQGAITSKESKYAPVKLLNTKGNDIMKRNGFFGPGGEVNVSNLSTATITGASRIIDVAVGPEGTWSIIDEKRSKVYTYDNEGNLLHIFGDSGTQLGNISSIEAIAYLGDDILVLDKSAMNITKFRRTEYGDLLISAIKNTNERNYDQTINYWRDILQRNNNFDSAYIGIGKSLYRSADYEESLTYYKSAYDTTNYSDSYKELRTQWMSKFFVLIPIGAVILILLIVFFFKYAGKVNKATALKVGRKSFKEEILYTFHLIFHPFDGFWDLKHEQRGSLRGAFFWIIVTILAFFYQSIGTGYIFNPRDTYSTIFIQIISVIVPLVLWTTANWCLTTLFDGEGSFKDVFIATSYALAPLAMFIVPATIYSNFAIENEGLIINLLISIGFVWAGMLIFFASQVTHDYTFSKNILTTLGTIVGMAVIMFVALLFSTLLTKIMSFIADIITEIAYRF
ncbi:MAG: YIP1 family protein [Clostridia bacterium]|nr:YIP1 family protein [Clostridia bacterium]